MFEWEKKMKNCCCYCLYLEVLENFERHSNHKENHNKAKERKTVILIDVFFRYAYDCWFGIVCLI